MINLTKVLLELKSIQPEPDWNKTEFEFSFEGYNPETMSGRRENAGGYILVHINNSQKHTHLKGTLYDLVKTIKSKGKKMCGGYEVQDIYLKNNSSILDKHIDKFMKKNLKGIRIDTGY